MVTERFRSYEEKNQRSDQTQRGASSSEAGRIRDFILYESQQKRERETQSQQKELFQSPPDEQESSNEKKNPRPETPKQKQETTSAQSEILLKKQEGLAEYMDDKWRGENKDNGSTDRLLNFNRLRIELERLRQKDRYLIMLSNRGPVEYQLTTDHKIERKSGVGGLSTALAGIGTYGIAVKWFSSPMSAGDRKVMEEGFPHHFVPLSEEIYTQYYNRISNNVLWFVFHEMYHQGEQNVSELAQHWKSYIQANRAFADAVHTQMKENAKQEPVVMIQDYHLLQVAGMLRERHPTILLQHFLHIPWPKPKVWKELPAKMVKDIYRGMCGNDIIGFQTNQDAQNFLKGAQIYLPDAEINFKKSTVRRQKHATQMRVYPISISIEKVREMAYKESDKHNNRDIKKSNKRRVGREEKYSGFPGKEAENSPRGSH